MRSGQLTLSLSPNISRSKYVYQVIAKQPINIFNFFSLWNKISFSLFKSLRMIYIYIHKYLHISIYSYKSTRTLRINLSFSRLFTKKYTFSKATNHKFNKQVHYERLCPYDSARAHFPSPALYSNFLTCSFCWYNTSLPLSPSQ